MTATADVVDEHGHRAHVCDLVLHQYGARRAFQGEVSTIRCHEDNVLVRECVASAGHGRVLVVDGGGSLRCALIGDTLAGLARDNGWAGLVVNGAVRDATSLRRLELGIKALGSHPRRSGKTGGGAIDVPVAFGGVTIRPGAMLYSDDDGLVVLDQPA